MFYLIVATLVVFSAASVIYQWDACKPTLRRFDPCGFLPNYSFFAPMPMVNDYRLVYRLDPDQSGEWKEIPICSLLGSERTFYNPDKYCNKAFIDSSNFLIKEYAGLESKNKQFIQLSTYYIGILQLVAYSIQRERAKPWIARFAVVSSENTDELKIKSVIFSSAVHEL